MKITDSDLDRLMDGLAITSFYGCWEWTKAKRGKGYGVMSISMRQYDVHRIMYAASRDLDLLHMPNSVVRHWCNNKSCANFMHLLGGTQKQNAQDYWKTQPPKKLKTYEPPNNLAQSSLYRWSSKHQSYIPKELVP